MIDRVKKAMAKKNIFTQQLVPVMIAGALLMGVFWVSSSIPTGVLSWLFSLPPLIIIVVCMLARLLDLKDRGLLWDVRRLSFVIAAAGCASIGLAPMLDEAFAYPTWRAGLTFWGIAGVFATAPNMPPLWPYISGERKLKKGAKP